MDPLQLLLTTLLSQGTAVLAAEERMQHTQAAVTKPQEDACPQLLHLLWVARLVPPVTQSHPDSFTVESEVEGVHSIAVHEEAAAGMHQHCHPLCFKSQQHNDEVMQEVACADDTHQH